MQITVEVKLEQGGRVVRRTAGVGAAGFAKLERVQIEAGDERRREAHRVFRGDIIFQAFGKEQGFGHGPVQRDASCLL